MKKQRSKQQKNALHFLAIAMKHASREARLISNNLRYAVKDPPRFAGEPDTAGTGKTKSFTIQLYAENNQHRDFIALFEYLNDLRVIIAKEIEAHFKDCESKGWDVEKSFQEYYKKWKVHNLAPGSLPFSAIRDHVKDYLQRNPTNYDPVKIASWIGRDLEGKLESYRKLSAKNGLKNQASSLFTDWRDSDGETIPIDAEIASTVLQKQVKSIKPTAFQKELLAKALKVLGGKSRFKNLDFNEDGKTRQIKGPAGVEEYNVLVRQLNIYIGQYNGQLTQKILRTLSEKYNHTFKTVRALQNWKVVAGTNGSLAQQYFEEQRNRQLPKSKLIKDVPGFPTFKSTAEIKSLDKPELTALTEFDSLLKQIEQFPFDPCHFESFFNQERHQSSLRDPDYKPGRTSMARAANKRLSRRIHFHGQIPKALNEELDYLRTKLQKCRKALELYITPNKLRQASFYAQRVCQLLLQSRANITEYEKHALDLRVKKFFGELQMQALKYTKKKQFSFQFRNWDQAGIYPVIETINNKDQFYIYLHYKRDANLAQSKSIEYVNWIDEKSGGTQRTLKQKSLQTDDTFKIRAMFSRRQGRKFLFNSVLGINAPHGLPISKVGTPNVVVKYDSQGRANISVVLSLTKGLFIPHGINYPRTLKTPRSRAEYLLNEIRFLIGVDRGENKIFSVSVYDVKNDNVVEQLTLGEDFLSRIKELKQKQADLQRQGTAKAKLRNITRRISNLIHHAMVSAVNDLLLIANQYSAEGATGIVFEFLNRQFRRSGRKAYVELNQMHEALKRVKEARNYFGFPFHIFEVGPAFTSQACSSCGVIKASNRNGEHFKCDECGYEDDADIQASLNIVYKWLAKRYKEIHGWKEDDKEALTKFIRERLKYARAG